MIKRGYSLQLGLQESLGTLTLSAAASSAPALCVSAAEHSTE